MTLKTRKAFSLIELSIVLLIIGIVVAGVTQASRLISSFKLSSARSLTQSSPVASMKNIMLWSEATSASSITDSEADNGLAVTTWYDINPTSTQKNNFSGSSSARPFYTTNCMNSLPCLRFDGSDDLMTFDGTSMVNSDYTVIIVEQRRNNASSNFFIAGNVHAVNQMLHLGYRTNTSLTFAQIGNDFDMTVAAYSSPTPKIHVFRYSSANGKNHYLNGAVTLNNSSTEAKTGLSAYSGARIGSATFDGPSNVFFNGDISEVIIFTRAITTEERQSIQTYLGKKWGIAVV